MRKWIIAVVFCFLVIFLTESSGVAAGKYYILGLVLDFPPGSLDPVGKIELYIDKNPDYYTDTPGYKNIQNYIKSIEPNYTGEDFPGALGLDWVRIDWDGQKITYKGGSDTLQSGIVDGYVYNNYRPDVTNVILEGYQGRIKFTYFYSGYSGSYYILPFIAVPYDTWEIFVEDDYRLEDVIWALQVLAGIQPSSVNNNILDIDGNHKIGIPDVIYMMQKISGRR
jgi:hypothetical protein